MIVVNIMMVADNNANTNANRNHKKGFNTNTLSHMFSMPAHRRIQNDRSGDHQGGVMFNHVRLRMGGGNLHETMLLFHEFVHFSFPKPWDHQLRNERVKFCMSDHLTTLLDDFWLGQVKTKIVTSFSLLVRMNGRSLPHGKPFK